MFSGIPADNNFTAENVTTQTAKAIGVRLVIDNEIELKKEKGLKLFGSNIYLNEAVTSDVREILREARKLREAKKIAAVWTWRGKLFIRLDQENKDERIHIPSLCDLHRICDAAAGCENVIDSNT